MRIFQSDNWELNFYCEYWICGLQLFLKSWNFFKNRILIKLKIVNFNLQSIKINKIIWRIQILTDYR